jgi:glycosyltransferase involved in cell wall biosynthesis
MRKVKPLISIIIPNYNHEKYLAQRLESVFNQTYTDFEVILLDDCSTDNSRAILLEYAKNPKVSHCVFNEINSGNTFVQWNKGIALAKGECIWVAETDDFCELNFLEELIKPLIEDKDIVLSYCQSNRVDEHGIVTGTWLNHTEDLDAELFTTDFCMEGNEFVERFLICKNVIPNASAVVFRNSEAQAIGCLDTNVSLKFVSDWLFYLHLILNKKTSFNSFNLNYFRFHSKSAIAVSIQFRTLSETNFILLNSRKKIKRIINLNTPLNKEKLIKINKIEIKKLVSANAFFLVKKFRFVRFALKIKDKIKIVYNKLMF